MINSFSPLLSFVFISFCCVWHFNSFFWAQSLGFSMVRELESQQRSLTVGWSPISSTQSLSRTFSTALLSCFTPVTPFPHSAGEPKRYVLFFLPKAHSHSPHILQALTSSRRRLCPPKLLQSCSHLCSPAPSSTRRLLMGGSHFSSPAPTSRLPRRCDCLRCRSPTAAPVRRCTPTLCFHYRHHQEMTKNFLPMVFLCPQVWIWSKCRVMLLIVQVECRH